MRLARLLVDVKSGSPVLILARRRGRMPIFEAIWSWARGPVAGSAVEVRR